MKLEELKIMYHYVGNNYFELNLTLKISGELDFGSNGYGSKVLNNFIKNECPYAGLRFAGGFGGDDIYDIIYRTKTFILGSKNTINLLGPFAFNKAPVALDQETFEPENPNEKIYQIYEKCIQNIQEYVGNDITSDFIIFGNSF